MDISLRQIGERLCARRQQMDMTQEQLAEKANVTAQTISYAELGKKAMRADTIASVCDALEISADYLLFGEITAKELSAFDHKISQLSPEQFRCLESIIDSFITAVTLNKGET